MTFRRDISGYGKAPGPKKDAVPNGSPGSNDLDVIIIGAGFGGVYLLHHLRKAGYNCKVLEAGTDLGGIWHWNCYPGARVDSMVPVYEYSIPEVWKDWTWSEAYPAWPELQRYFDHVDKVLDIRKDVIFEKRVVGAEYDAKQGRWGVDCEDGWKGTSRFLVVATGFAAKRHFPDWPGLETFKGEMHHSSFWPQDGVDVKGKSVAVIGTGSTGIQIAQETARTPGVKKVTVFQRTPNLALPMAQRKITKEDQDKAKSGYPEFFDYRMTTFAGFGYDFRQVNTMDDTPEEREAFYQKLWDHGGFEFWLATYKDMLFDNEANNEAYRFWQKKQSARIKDPRKKAILTPEVAPHAFGTKRPSLEQDFYDLMNQDHMDVVDIKNNPVVEIVPEGLKLKDGTIHEIDILAMATGFDSVTGGMKSMGLKNIYGETLAQTWSEGTWSYLGMTCNGYPNMFFLYGAQGPTAFSNGPSCVESQGNWIIDAIKKIKDEGIKSVNATKEAEERWRKNVTELSDKTLFPQTDSWYMGANIPGKPREQLNYAGGIPLYEKEIRSSLKDWDGFEVERPTAKAA